MGIKGFYGYCTRNIPECHKKVNIIEEIEKYKSTHHDNPVLVINLWTLSYHYHIQVNELLCGYQLNKIKKDIETFFGKLKNAGAELVFVFKKSSGDDNEFLKRRLSDYNDAVQLLKKIEKIKSFEKLSSIYQKFNGRGIAYNVLILVTMIQTAKNFGSVHGANSIDCKPSVMQADLASSLNAAWVLGLDTYFFFLPGSWKIWTEDKLNMEEMTIEEYDKDAILKHFEMDFEHMQMMAILSGDIQTKQNFRQKISDYFGTKNKFNTIKCFIKKLSFPMTDEILEEVAVKMLGKNYNPLIKEDIKKSLASYKSNPNAETTLDPDIMNMIRNDFLSFAEEILLNKTSIFITPVFLNLNNKDMVDFNTLVFPFIQKTAGILLKNSEDKSPRKIRLLESAEGKFVEVPLEVIYPEFDVPDLKVMLKGEMSTLEKMKMLFWIVDVEKQDDFELSAFPMSYVIDCLILFYLIKRNSLTILDARCILKTLVESRNSDELRQISTEFPKNINSRALRCSFLYSKCYFILHSCLACIGMKNYCPDITFDGVFFQKMYALNVLNENEDEEQTLVPDEIVAEPTTTVDEQNVSKTETEIIPGDSGLSQTEIIDLFRKIVQEAQV